MLIDTICFKKIYRINGNWLLLYVSWQALGPVTHSTMKAETLYSGDVQLFANKEWWQGSAPISCT